MQSVISNISNTFIEEAKASPRMLEDLAAMEKYMSESYDGRTFVELIQNADDANASRIRVEYAEDALIVANDGRSFDENDIMAICRSGSSNKQRGKNIGYRGVGFKSATTISTEIVIYSAGVYFTFSKSQCARTLGIAQDKVPTVRIPFLFDGNELTNGCSVTIEMLESEGFTTFFIFRNPRIEKFSEELSGFNSGWLLFLRKVSNIDVNLPSMKKVCKVTRKKINNDLLVKIIGGREQWLIISNEGVSLAFKYDDEKGVVPCASEDAVFHCFLPTMDKTGFPFKVNSDFSTDPSRKHIIVDEVTNSAIEAIAKLFSDTVSEASENKDGKRIALISLLNTHISLGDLASRLEQKIDNNLRISPWVLKNNGDVSTAQNVRYLPGWLDLEDKKKIVEAAPHIGNEVYHESLYSGIDKIEKIISKYGAREIAQDDLRALIADSTKANMLGEALVAKVFVYCYRNSYSDKDLMNDVFIPTTAGYVRLSDTSSGNELDHAFLSFLISTLTAKEKTTISDGYAVFGTIKNKTAVPKKVVANAMKMPAANAALAINKWKSPIQNCLAAEMLSGHSGKDVSRKCDDYDVESVDAQGNQYYIAVKLVKALGDTFSLDEKEYAAAQRLGEAYRVFVVSTEGEKVRYTYISNPVDTVNLEKIVKEWEFVCNSYEIPEDQENEQDNTLIDERILKNLSLEYFTSAQKAFIADFMNSGKMLYSPELSTMIESINSVVDFYTGEKLFEIKGDAIKVEASKANALKKIIGS